MFFKITNSEYKKLKEKYLDLKEEYEDKKVVNNSLKREVEDLRRHFVELTYREELWEKERLELNNTITNLLMKINELNSSIINEKKKNKSETENPKTRRKNKA